MTEPLDETYLNWLYGQVASVRLKNPARTHWRLLKVIFSMEFIWLVSNDDNRLEDGRDIRYEFIEELNIEVPDEEWMTVGCSLLEMMIGLARRLAFNAEGDSDQSEWFWHMIHNLGLREFNDLYFDTDRQEEYVIHILETMIWRNYRSDGRGGLFPLRDPKEDQREVELWYQLSSYLLEGHTA